MLDKGVGSGKHGRSLHLRIAGFQISVTDIVSYRSCKQVAVLKHHSQRTAQVRLFDLVDIDTVIADLSVLNIIKPVDQVCDRRLSGTRRSYEGHLLAGLRVKPDIVKHHLVFRISEIYAVHHHIALQFRIGQGSIVMGMLPGPDSRPLRNLHKLAVLPAGINQRYIPVVLLRGLIHQGKDTLRACKRHDNGIKLLRNLRYRLVEASRQLQERRQTSKRQATHISDSQQSSHNRSQHVIDISNIGHYRHQNIGKDVRVARAVKKLVIELFKSLLRLFLVAEDLHHFLAIHHFFDVGVYNTQISLLRHKVAS